MRRILLLLPLLALSGCAMSARPARTEVKPGESEIVSERDERRPTETRLYIKAKPQAPAQEPAQSVHIRLTVPKQ